jgi:hypothetical protein
MEDIDLMYAAQQFVREKLADGKVIDELAEMLEQHGVDATLIAAAKPEILRTISLIFPGLMLDFLAALDSGEAL